MGNEIGYSKKLVHLIDMIDLLANWGSKTGRGKREGEKTWKRRGREVDGKGK